MKRFKVTGESEVGGYLWFQLFGAFLPPRNGGCYEEEILGGGI